MRRFFGEVKQDKFMLNGEDFKHLAVLRFSVGDEFLGICNDEYEYLCRIDQLDKKQAICSIISKQKCLQNPKVKITLFQALPKAEKLELITQKITELGATDLVLFTSEFTVAKPNPNKISRLEKITIEASKQCQRSTFLNIHPPITFDEMLKSLDYYDAVLFAYEKQKDIEKLDLKNYKNIAIIIGSEGGFSNNEVEKILQKSPIYFGLGKRILRCETAAIMSVGIVSYFVEN